MFFRVLIFAIYFVRVIAQDQYEHISRLLTFALVQIT